MPSYAKWKELYHEEYFQLREEGYLVDGATLMDEHNRPLPFPADLAGESHDETADEPKWEALYHALWKTREKGLRPDFPFHEPDSYKEIIAEAAPEPSLEPLDCKEYEQRIKGAWFGRLAGVALGKPLEMGWDWLKVKEYLESVNAYPLQDWVPARSDKLNVELRADCVPSTKGNVRYMQPDDDVHYTIMSLLLAEQKGLEFTKLDVGMNLLDNIPYHWLWCSDRHTYCHLVNMDSKRSKEEQIDEFPTRLNPWRECMAAFLKADFWGYITPGEPRKGAPYIYRVATLNLIKNGIYGGMFVQGCISAALSKNPSPEAIIRGGLSVIPKNSRLACAITDVCQWYAANNDFAIVCEKIYAKYGHLHFCSSMNNLAFVTLSVLHSKLDYTTAITTAVMCGTDTDCNAGTVGSIVAAAVGYDRLECRWIDPLNDTVKTVVAHFGQGSITELANRTVSLYKQL